MRIAAPRAVRLIARREVNARLRTRGFVVGTVVILVVLAGYLLLQTTLTAQRDKVKIGLTGQAIGVAAELEADGAQIGKHVETIMVAGPEQGRQQIGSGDLDALLSGSAADLHVLVKSELGQELRAMLNGISGQQVLNAKLVEADLDPAQVMREVSAATVSVSTLEPPDPGRGQRMAIGMVMVFLLYFGIQTYGASVAQGVVEEKASRVVEILLATVRPWQLMLGKILGLGLVGLTQLAILAGAGLAMATATGVLTLTGVAASTIGWGILWYLLGFFLYATVYAAAGSLVSRQEDSASVLTPVTMVLMVGFLAGFNFLLQNPEGGTAKALSLIPLYSPILMPGRMAAGAAAGWEVALSLVLTLATGALLTAVAGRVYRNGVLHTGTRLNLSTALRG
ncbi:MAG TPA: ABC transporter permease [Amycolatopsis sp.]|nr:ABC transporter permease [Amycolatopsis sp.]HKS45232.1 ABC transporter permease [Amycolatopsis sp.]